MTLRAFGQLFRAALAGWWNDNVPRLGASLSFYTLFAFAPVLIVSIAIAGLVFRPEVVRGEIVQQLRDLVGGQAAQAIQAMLEGAGSRSESQLATGLGLFTFFLGATGAFLELQTALNGIWKVKPKEDTNFLKDLVVARLISFGLVIAVGFLLLVSLVVSAAVAALSGYLDVLLPGLGAVWQGLNLLVSLIVFTALFALVYKILPDVDLSWNSVLIGAAMTAVLFSLGKFLIGLYLGQSGFASSYGAAGSIIVLLLWVYYSSQIVLLGAEFTRAYTERFGRLARPMRHAEPDPAPASVQEPGKA